MQISCCCFSENSSPVTVEHVLASFFLALLPQQRSLVNPRAWNAIANAIRDDRLLIDIPTVSTTNCAQAADECACDQSASEPDIVCAVLRLRETLRKVQSFCQIGGGA